MKLITTMIPDVLIIEPTIHVDERGSFWESFNQRQFVELIGRDVRFVQDNHSRSRADVLRGLHYQLEKPQAKLVGVVAGEIYDVAVDLRRSSPTFGRWVGAVLSAENLRQMWIPEGFAHGFLVLSAHAEVLYKVSDDYSPAHERTLLWSDETLNIEWPQRGAPMLSAKDQAASRFAEADFFP